MGPIAKVEHIQPGAGKLGTFGGVFTPSILTILGLILFLRLGYVVGSAGLQLALLIIFLSCAISILHTLRASRFSLATRCFVAKYAELTDDVFPSPTRFPLSSKRLAEVRQTLVIFSAVAPFSSCRTAFPDF